MYHRILPRALPAAQRGHKSVQGMHSKSVLGIGVHACARRLRLSTPPACDQGERVWKDERRWSDVCWVLVGCVVTAVTWATHRRQGV